MLIKIGEKCSVNIMSISAIENKINKEDPNRIVTIIYLQSGSTFQLDEEESKHFNEFMKKILPDVSTEQGQNFVIQTLQKASQNIMRDK